MLRWRSPAILRKENLGDVNSCMSQDRADKVFISFQIYEKSRWCKNKRPSISFSQLKLYSKMIKRSDSLSWHS